MRNRTVFVVFVMLAAMTAFAGPQAPKSAAPRDPELIDAQGYQKLVEQYRGKPLLVNFWATWCEPCRHEYPMLNELAKQYAPISCPLQTDLSQLPEKSWRRRGFPASGAGWLDRSAPCFGFLRKRWAASRSRTWRRIAGNVRDGNSLAAGCGCKLEGTTGRRGS